MYSSEHYEMVMHSGSMAKVMPKLIWHLEDLRVGMSYPNYLISGLVSKFVKVVLSGAGGDELFGGYPWRYKVVEKSKKTSEFDKKYYDYWSRLIKDNEKKNFFTKNYQKNIDFSDNFNQYRKIISKVDGLPPIEKALYFELKTFLHGLFVVEDKVSMAHSIEVRVPFADLELIELATSMPYNLKISSNLGKVILRKAMEEILPKEITNKKKQGFSPPEGSWYKDESLSYVKEILLDKKTLNRGIIEPKFVKRIIAEHASGKENHRLMIWSLLSFEWWCRVFLDKEKQNQELRVKK
jgi:asparagine synthase (glutamine-hydrolysing)